MPLWPPGGLAALPDTKGQTVSFCDTCSPSSKSPWCQCPTQLPDHAEPVELEAHRNGPA